MKIIGIMLVSLGLLALIYGGLNYTRNRTILKMGSMSVTATEHKSIPVPAVAGLVVLLGGVALLVVGQRRLRSA
jgi:hypothetical protein